MPLFSYFERYLKITACRKANNPNVKNKMISQNKKQLSENSSPNFSWTVHLLYKVTAVPVPSSIDFSSTFILYLKAFQNAKLQNK